MKNITSFLLLHVLFIVYSFSGIFSKYASFHNFFNMEFCLLYFLMILILGIYAIGWQQIIKNLPLSTAFAHKSVTVIWGMVWGMVFFGEEFSLGKGLGICFIILGMILYTKSEEG